MRGTLGIAILALALLAPMVPPLSARAELASVFYPVKRIVCDRKNWACYDALGASVPITKAHLGDQAAGILQQRIDKAGKRWNPSHFVLSNGIDCWTEKKTCYVRVGSEEVEARTTAWLFGSR